MVDATLVQIDFWYNEPTSQTGDRPQLLSKLALLELCGWIEGEFDRLLLKAEAGRVRDRKWLEKKVVARTSGFDYRKHLRRMFMDVFGELLVQRIEDEMEAQFPGDLERLEKLLDDLWTKRCSFAHADLVANVASQRVFDAPSWSRSQLRVVKILISEFDIAMTKVLTKI
jgi:hypothetical protein